MDEHLNLAVLVGCLVLLVAVLAVRVASRTGLPVLLLYLALGIGLGESGLGVQFSDYGLTADLGLLALAVILAEGGLTTRWAAVRPVLPFAVAARDRGRRRCRSASSPAPACCCSASTRASRVILGGVVSSTDAAAVFSVLRRLRLRERVSVGARGRVRAQRRPRGRARRARVVVVLGRGGAAGDAQP